MYKFDHYSRRGNDRYEGFCVDMLAQISTTVGFEFTLYEVADQTYGKMADNGADWNGIVGELARGVSKCSGASEYACTGCGHGVGRVND
jgi:hypothetical protein